MAAKDGSPTRNDTWKPDRRIDGRVATPEGGKKVRDMGALLDQGSDDKILSAKGARR